MKLGLKAWNIIHQTTACTIGILFISTYTLYIAFLLDRGNIQFQRWMKNDEKFYGLVWLVEVSLWKSNIVFPDIQTPPEKV